MPDIDNAKMIQAYERMQPAFRAIPKDRIQKPKVDLTTASGTVLAALPKIEKHKAALLALPHTRKELVEELADRALAMLWAFAGQKTVLKETLPLPALLERGAAVRKTMLLAADVLVNDGNVPQSFVDDVRAGSGHRDLASDLLALGGLVHKQWEHAKGRSPATPELVQESLQLGEALSVALGERAQPVEQSEAAEMRDRAYTHFLEAYNEVRTALAYLRARDGDAEQILPSVFANRRGGSKEEPVDGAAPGPAPSPIVGGAPVNGGGAQPADPDSPFVT